MSNVSDMTISWMYACQTNSQIILCSYQFCALFIHVHFPLWDLFFGIPPVASTMRAVIPSVANLISAHLGRDPLLHLKAKARVIVRETFTAPTQERRSTRGWADGGDWRFSEGWLVGGLIRERSNADFPRHQEPNDDSFLCLFLNPLLNMPHFLV